jgi:hypothetical protein
MKGFNKRYLNEESIRVIYKGGYGKLERFIREPDALIVEDEFTQKIVNLVIEGNSKIRIKILMK